MSPLHNRRKFIHQIGIAGTGIWLAGMSTQWSACSEPAGKKNGENPSFHPFGIQLWSVKEDMAVDPKEVYKKLSAAGYTQIETFEGAQGILWGMSPAEYKTYLGDLGLRAVAGHCNINENFEQKVAEATEVGMEYLICPHIGANDSLDYYKEHIDKFNKCAEICASSGIKFAYHNHDYSFRPVEGVIPQQLMMDSTDKGKVFFEMDIYWVALAEQDPIEWLNKYPGRWPLVHVKDMEEKTEDIGSTQLGTGKLDFPALLSTAKSVGTEYLIIEQEKFIDITPMEAAKQNAAYMKQLKLG